MNLDVQVEGSRIASELVHLRNRSQAVDNKPAVNGLFLLVVKGFALSLGIVSSLICILFLNVEVAFISITAISFITLGLVIGGRKIARLLAPLEAKFFSR